MMVAMIAYPEFFKKHMKVNIGIAPVCYMSHYDVGLIKALGNTKLLVNTFEKLCPEIFDVNGCPNQFIKNFHSVNGVTQTLPLKLVIEKNPRFASKKAVVNYGGHCPNGASFKQNDHFRQMMFTKKF